MYIVVKSFKDLQDEGHIYHAGDEYPRVGLVASSDRIKALKGANKNRTAYIKAENPVALEAAAEAPVEKPEEAAVEEPERKKPTRSELSRMNANELRKVMRENGRDDVDNLTRAEMQEWLSNKLGL